MTKINPIHGSGMLIFKQSPDAEHKRIIRRLMVYGYTPTYNKNSDYNMLRRIELKLAKMENCISSKYITVTKAEQEKIQEKKKAKREENNPELKQNSTKGQEILGEQIMLAIEWKERRKNK